MEDIEKIPSGRMLATEFIHLAEDKGGLEDLEIRAQALKQYSCSVYGLLGW